MIAPLFSNVTVVIVAFNSAKMLEINLPALAKMAKVVVVDNNSRDNSVDVARRTGVTVIANEVNGGFGHASNQGAAIADTDYILFANPDAVLDGESLSCLIEEMERYGAAIVAPILFGNEGLPELRAGDFHGLGLNFSEDPALIPEGPCCSAFLSAAMMLWRTSDWREIGGFDERIFLYWEDLDLCLRARRANKQMILVPRARSSHVGAASSPPSLRIRWIKEWHVAWGQYYCEAKYHSLEAGRRLAFQHIRRHGLRALRAILSIRARRFVRNMAVIAAAITFLRQNKAART